MGRKPNARPAPRVPKRKSKKEKPKRAQEPKLLPAAEANGRAISILSERGFLNADDYRSRAEVEQEWRRDPLAAYGRKLISEKILKEAEVEKISADAMAQIDRAVAIMQAAKSPTPESALEDVFAN